MAEHEDQKRLEEIQNRYTKEQLARAVFYLATEHYSLKRLDLSDFDKIITLFPFQREALERLGSFKWLKNTRV